MERRRQHYSTALTQAQGIVPESLALFEAWTPGMKASELLEETRASNLLGSDSDRRVRNVVIEGFGSRYLRKPFVESASSLKRLFSQAPARLTLEIMMLYAMRQHGIFFDFLVETYWPAVRAGRLYLDRPEILVMIDRGRVDQKLERDWSETVRKRVATYTLGIAQDFELVSASSNGRRAIQDWAPSEKAVLYLAYDLHFLDLSDDEVVGADEWAAWGFEREDVLLHLHRLEEKGFFTVQDTGLLCRVDWKFSERKELIDALV